MKPKKTLRRVLVLALVLCMIIPNSLVSIFAEETEAIELTSEAEILQNESEAQETESETVSEEVLTEAETEMEIAAEEETAGEETEQSEIEFAETEVMSESDEEKKNEKKAKAGGEHDVLEDDYAYIKAFEITKITDGTVPFDTDTDSGSIQYKDRDGNDENDSNLRVRSFDSIKYDLTYRIALHDTTMQIKSGWLCYEFQLPYSSAEAEFDVDNMLWMGSKVAGLDGLPEGNSGYTITKSSDGYQVITGKRWLTPSSDNPTPIPGVGSLAVEVKVKSMKNGDTVQPSFTAWMEHGTTGKPCTEHGYDEYITAVPETVNVTAMMKMNIQIKQASTAYINAAGTFDFTTGDALAFDRLEGKVKGRIKGYGVTLQLYNDVAAKGLKGLEMPTGNITFDLELNSTFSADGKSAVNVTSDYRPLVWTAGAATANQYGQDGRDKTANTNSNNVAGGAPLNKGSTTGRCHDGGIWQYAKAEGSNKISVTVSDYQFDVTKFPWVDYNVAAYNKTYYDPDSSIIPIGCFSAGELYILQPYYNLNTGEYVLDEFRASKGDFYTILEDYNLRATSVTGESLENVSDNSNQIKQSDDKVPVQVTLFTPGAFSTYIWYSNSNPNLHIYDPYGRPHTDTSSYVHSGRDWGVNGFELGISWGIINTNNGDYENTLIAGNSLMKFDPEALELTGGMQYSTEVKAAASYGYKVAVLYATKENGHSWNDDEEMKAAKMEDLRYFSSLKEAQDYGEVIGILLEVRPSGEPEDIVMMSTNSFRAQAWVRIKSSSLLQGNVYMVCTGAKLWRITEYEAAGAVPSLLDNDPDDPIVLPNATTTTYPNYVKSWYDDSGYAGGHTGTYSTGDSLLVLGYKTKITKEVAQKENDGNAKQVYQLDYNQRVVDYRLQPSTIVANSESTNLKTMITIKDTLPKGLTYRPGSAYFGGTYEQNSLAGYPGSVVDGKPLEPDVDKRADGTTILTWVIHTTIGEPIDAIHYSADIGSPGAPDDVDTNASFLNKVQISSTEDKRDINLVNQNYAEAGIRVSKLGSLSHSKTADQVMNEKGSTIGYTLNLGNNGNNEITEALLVDILPFNGDKYGSSFEGSLTVANWKLLTSAVPTSKWQNWEIYYTEDIGARDLTTDDYVKADIRDNNYPDITWKKLSIESDGTIPGLDGKEPTAVAMIVTIKEKETAKFHMEMQAAEAESGSKFANNLVYGDLEVTTITYYVSRTLSGVVWNDVSEDGRRDAEEKMISGVTVTLLQEDSENPGKYIPVQDEDGKPVTVKTDAGGAYSFKDLAAGKYGVMFGNGSELDDYIASPENASGVSDYYDSDGIPAYDQDGKLEYTTITGIVMPETDQLGTYLFESKYHDTGLYKHFNATYEYVSSTPGMNLPKEITDMLPNDQSDIKDGTEITASAPAKTTVIDDANDGIWTFDGWDESTQTIDGEDIHFIGRWTFTPNKYKATHEFESGTPNMELPDEINDFLPKDITDLLDKAEPEAGTPSQTTYNDEENDGTWDFKEWDEDKKTINRDDVEFVGTWEFTPNKYKATHEFQSGTEGMELPDQIKEWLPEDINGLLNKQTADAEPQMN